MRFQLANVRLTIFVHACHRLRELRMAGHAKDVHRSARTRLPRAGRRAGVSACSRSPASSRAPGPSVSASGGPLGGAALDVRLREQPHAAGRASGDRQLAALRRPAHTARAHVEAARSLRCSQEPHGGNRLRGGSAVAYSGGNAVSNSQLRVEQIPDYVNAHRHRADLVDAVGIRNRGVRPSVHDVQHVAFGMSRELPRSRHRCGDFLDRFVVRAEPRDAVGLGFDIRIRQHRMERIVGIELFER